MITAEEGQKIANRLIDILGKNINIIDLSGKVIASTDKERIGSFHEAARIAAMRKENIIISNGNKNLFKGSREGINLPIFAEGQVLGVVGITGKSEDVKGYGMIVKELVELMICENIERSEKAMHEETERTFIMDLINEKSIEDLHFIEGRAKTLGFSQNEKRLTIVGDINFYNEENYVRFQKNKKLIKKLMIKYLSYDTFIINVYDCKILIIKKSVDNIYEILKKLSKEIKEVYDFDMKFIVSDACSKILDYSKAYESIIRVLDIVRKIKTNENVFFQKDYRLELLLNQIPKSKKEEYLKEYREIFKSIPKKKYKELLETVKTYYENNMNIGEVSNKLFLHRNTVSYRLKEFNEITGINVNNIIDCMKLYIAICLFNLE